MILRFHTTDLPGLNGKDGLLRIHWSKKKTIMNRIMVLILEQKPKKMKRAQVKMTNYYGNNHLDWDNMAAKCKLFFDALVALKIIPDDSPEYIVQPFEMYQEKVKMKDTRIEFEFTKV